MLFGAPFIHGQPLIRASGNHSDIQKSSQSDNTHNSWQFPLLILVVTYFWSILCQLKIDASMNKEDIWRVMHPSWTSSFLDSIQQNFQGLHFELYHKAAAIAVYFSLWNQINRYVSTLKTSLWNPINIQIYKSDSNSFFDFWNFVVQLQDIWIEDIQVQSGSFIY